MPQHGGYRLREAKKPKKGAKPPASVALPTPSVPLVIPKGKRAPPE